MSETALSRATMTAAFLVSPVGWDAQIAKGAGCHAQSVHSRAGPERREYGFLQGSRIKSREGRGMGQEDKEPGRMGLSRRDFLKVSAAGAVAATALDWAPAPAMAQMPFHTVAGGYSDTDTAILRYHTTCPYCSASCGQLVAVGNKTGDVYDIYGDFNSPINNGGLCAKGAGAYQLVTNARRLGVPEHTAVNPDSDGKDMTGTAWVRVANSPWTEISLATAMTEIAAGSSGKGRDHLGLVGYRNANGQTPAAGNYYNSDGVMFFGSSHMNNEQNYLYRKLVATFGTSNIEHQARI